jgi:hypothetical protein
MGRMTPADAIGRTCAEPRCPQAHPERSHAAVYRVDATSDTGEVRRRDLCMAAAPAAAARIQHPFPPGPWK